MCRSTRLHRTKWSESSVPRITDAAYTPDFEDEAALVVVPDPVDAVFEVLEELRITEEEVLLELPATDLNVEVLWYDETFRKRKMSNVSLLKRGAGNIPDLETELGLIEVVTEFETDVYETEVDDDPFETPDGLGAELEGRSAVEGLEEVGLGGGDEIKIVNFDDEVALIELDGNLERVVDGNFEREVDVALEIDVDVARGRELLVGVDVVFERKLVDEEVAFEKKVVDDPLAIVDELEVEAITDVIVISKTKRLNGPRRRVPELALWLLVKSQPDQNTNRVQEVHVLSASPTKPSNLPNQYGLL